jgi:hypothetical protein
MVGFFGAGLLADLAPLWAAFVAATALQVSALVAMRSVVEPRVPVEPTVPLED